MSVRPHDIPPYPRDGGEETAAVPKGDMLAAALTAAGLLLIVAALTIAAYPYVSAKWETYRSSQQFSSERAVASQYDDAVVDSLISNAEAYNASIAGASASVADAYDEQLSYDASRVLCWLDIPALQIKLPVYRDDGTDEVPTDGAEHICGTSLPVGGVPSNTVITAHSGSHGGTSMMFNKLDSIEVGDLVILWTLGRPYAYEVTGWEQTDPSDTSNMRIESDIDQLTLLTCRPIGTTAKRLFVHATRVDYEPEMEQGVRIDALAEPDFWQFIAACAIAGLAIWGILLVAWRRARVWHLNRALGAMCITEEEVAAYVDGGIQMRLELKSFGRARLALFGDVLKGSWKRVNGDASRISLRFAGNGNDAPFVRCSEPLGEQGIETVRLPFGRFEAKALDDELALAVDDGSTTLVFSQSRPRRQEGRSDRWEVSHR